MFDDRKYLIISVSEINKINFDEVIQNSPQYMRKSVDQTKTLIKWDGSDPSFISSLTSKDGPYSYDQILSIMGTSEWTEMP